jgi:hypothetical protein
MKLTKREKWALWSLLEFPIYRYLMANAVQRLDAGEKAQRHIEISKIIANFIFTCEDNNYKVNNTWLIIHDYLAEVLTDRMDEVIGFPINTPLYGNEFDLLAKKFFDIIVKHFEQIEKLIKRK